MKLLVSIQFEVHPSWSGRHLNGISSLRMTLALCLALFLMGVHAYSQAQELPQFVNEPPRVRAMLEQGRDSENGHGDVLNRPLALVLYCEAGMAGSPEGYYQLGRLLVDGPAAIRKPALGRGFLALAAGMGHQGAETALGDTPANLPETGDCAEFEAILKGSHFDMNHYIAGLSSVKQKVANLIRTAAPNHDIPVALALAIACVESNFDSRAVSPKNAQGVMQLIPDTQQRFGVKKPFEARQNIRGGLKYLKWLLKQFHGNVAHAVAAYNAGEGVVARLNDIPPYAETRAYVKRVLFYAGFTDGL
jgi:hypothetical protein